MEVTVLNWMNLLNQALEYIEQNLQGDCSVEQIADSIHVSPYYFQKSFKMMTGYTIGEYVRNRKLYLASLDLFQEKEKIIEIAARYGYDTPESFSKAFSRFHGVSPMQLRAEPYKMKAFHPLKVQVSLQGGLQLEYHIEKEEAFEVMGYGRNFSYEEAFEKIPEFWREFHSKKKNGFWKELNNCCIGKYGISIENSGISSSFTYYIADDILIQNLPEGFKKIRIPPLTWAKFHCIGPMPQALQAMNTRIFKEWLPNNTVYEIAAGYNVEWYSSEAVENRCYESEIWIPVRKIEQNF